MENKALRTFLTIARLQSFTLAAKHLNYAQSTVTFQIQSLENELGVQLFERLGHSITLTLAGKRLVPYAEQLLRLSEDARHVVKDSETPRGTLAIGAVESLCIKRVPELLKQYRLLYPEVEISVRFGTCSDFLRFLKENVIDVAFLLEPKIVEEDVTLKWESPEPLVLLASPEHALAGRTQITPEDLAAEPLILTEIGCSYRLLFENILLQHGIKPHPVIETGNVYLIKQFAMSGIGVTLLLRLQLRKSAPKTG